MQLSDNQLKFFADFIEKELGIVYSSTNYFQLDQRIEKIAQYLGIESKENVYQKGLTEGIHGAFKSYLLDTATNNETSFFRDPKVWTALETKILPNLKVNAPNNFIFRIWCSAASFGQEPYSLAMLVHEFMQKNPGHPRFEIIATDIADHALKRCQEARYSQLEVQRGLSASRLIKHFKKTEDDHWQLNDDIRRMVQFKKQNLLDPFTSIGTVDLVLCRYVLIYQDSTRKKQIVERLEKVVSPKGHLVLGASESALGLTKELKQVAHDGTIFYQKP